MNASGVHLILLAAGASTRFTDGPKQRARVDGEPMLRRAARVAVDAGAPVSVVLGAHAAELHELLDGLPVQRVVNPDWAEGLGTSIACGVRHVQQRHAGSSAVLLCLADQPRVDAAALARILHIHQHYPERIVCADHGTVLGPPCLFPRAYFPELARCTGPVGAGRLLEAHARLRMALRMPEAAIDIDTTDDLQRLQAPQPRPWG